MYMLVKQVPKLLRVDDKLIKNTAAQREIEMLKIVRAKVPQNHLSLDNKQKRVCNSIVNILDGSEDWWLVYEY